MGYFTVSIRYTETFSFKIVLISVTTSTLQYNKMHGVYYYIRIQTSRRLQAFTDPTFSICFSCECSRWGIFHSLFDLPFRSVFSLLFSSCFLISRPIFSFSVYNLKKQHKKNDSYKILKIHAENNFFFQIMLLQCRLSAVCRSGAAWTPQWSPVHSFRCHKHDWKVDAGSAAQYDTRAAHVSAICANHWREA